MSESSDHWDRRTDVVIVGSGTGLVAALKARQLGARVIVLEKASTVGGTTAISAAGLWLPNARPIVEERGREAVGPIKEYVRAVAGEDVPEPAIDRFLETAPALVDYVETETPLEFIYVGGFPDYHTEFEGAHPDGRRIEPALLDVSELGDSLDDVRSSPYYYSVPFTAEDMQTYGGFARFAADADMEALAAERADKVSGGTALVGGLYKACLDAGVVVHTDAPAERLIVEEGTVRGIEAKLDGDEETIRADAVVVAAGGFEWDQEMCSTFLPGPEIRPASPPNNEGDGIRMGMRVGAKLGNMTEAWWAPTARTPGEEWEDGTPVYRLLWVERTVPGCLLVNENGSRFCNEAVNYNDIVKAMQTFDPQEYEYPNVPSYMILDSDYRERYAIMSLQPGDPDPEWLTRAETLEELATKLGVDPEPLKHTVETFNEDARDGFDSTFGRGSTAHDRRRGDSETGHPNLAPVDRAPFYAYQVHPGALGTKGGLVTTPDAQVVDVDECVIPGLYATGNSTSHVMGVGYAGSGATLGPNLVFNYVAGQTAAHHSLDAT